MVQAGQAVSHKYQHSTGSMNLRRLGLWRSGMVEAGPHHVPLAVASLYQGTSGCAASLSDLMLSPRVSNFSSPVLSESRCLAISQKPNPRTFLSGHVQSPRAPPW